MNQNEGGVRFLVNPKNSKKQNNSKTITFLNLILRVQHFRTLSLKIEKNNLFADDHIKVFDDILIGT